MKRALFVFAAVLMTATAAHAVPASYWSDDFDSYADQNAFQAAWPSWATDNSTLPLFQNWGYPLTGGVETGEQSLAVGAFGSIVSNTRRNAHLLPAVQIPTDANPITLQYKLYDPNNGNTARQFVEYRAYKPAGDTQTTPWMPATYNNTDCLDAIQFGTYSAVAGGNTNYAFRVPFASNLQFRKEGTTTWTGGPAWTITKTTRSAGWHTLSVVVAPSTLKFMVDGHLDTLYYVRDLNNTALPGTWAGFDGVIVGSGLGTNMAAKYDDVLVTPEPMTLALLGFGSLLLRRRRVA